MPTDEEDDEITMQGVVSTNISAIGYSHSQQLLRIEFLSGHSWEYEGVDLQTFENLRDAGSVGGYFARAVKGRFTGREV